MHRFVTIPFSHFCEKARWALDHAEIPYVEEPHVPMLAWAAAIAASGQRQVPVLAPDDAKAIPGSTAILRWADARRPGGREALWPEDLDGVLAPYVAELDRALGPAARRAAYYHLLQDAAAVRELFVASARGWERRIAGAAHAAIAGGIRRGLKIDDTGYARSIAALERVFADADARLERTPYLAGERFSAADVAFASLAGPVLFTPAVEATVCPAERLGPGAQAMVERFRGTRSGAFTLRLYAEKRARSCGSSR